jgi:hypothetical protein
MQLCDADSKIYAEKFGILRNYTEYLERFAHNQW